MSLLSIKDTRPKDNMSVFLGSVRTTGPICEHSRSLTMEGDYGVGIARAWAEGLRSEEGGPCTDGSLASEAHLLLLECNRCTMLH